MGFFDRVAILRLMRSDKREGEISKYQQWIVPMAAGQVPVFLEHGHAPAASVARRRGRLPRLWKRCANGCYLNRSIESKSRESGFTRTDLKTGFRRWLRFAADGLWGHNTP